MSPIVHGVFAKARLGLEYDFLAAYSTRDRAQGFIDAQDERLRECLRIWEIEVDRHPEDEFWTAPGIAQAFHLLAGLPDDALPDDRVTGFVSHALDVAGGDALEGRTCPAPKVIARLRERGNTAERGADADELERQLAETRALVDKMHRERDIWARVALCAIEYEREHAALEAVMAARGVAKALPIVGAQEPTCTAATAPICDDIDAMAAALQERIRRHRPHLERLASGTDYARVCGTCGLAISQLAGYFEQSPLGHTHSSGQCDVCGRIGSISPSGDYRGEGDDSPP